ncbi:unnamed protein product [Pedinophyceae sp. YPF-701]|nr:unnamed protein product [Pedinophyceae sp. YPF-701]
MGNYFSVSYWLGWSNDQGKHASWIKDKYTTLDQVQCALKDAGLESSNLIVAIDFTASNTSQGIESFGGKCLHEMSDVPNPYEQALGVVAKTLSPFDEDGLIPMYGFGDARCHDAKLFCLNDANQPCQGLDECLWRYRQVSPHVKLSGPTSFAPAIYEAMHTVAESGGQYHILLIIADGAITRASSLPASKLSPQEVDTIDAIVAASEMPLSIVMVGVGDGPWDQMQDFDDKIPQRKFDNFQFVCLTDVVRKSSRGRSSALAEGQLPEDVQAEFAVQALMEVPEQFEAVQRLGLLGRRTALPPSIRRLRKPPLPPPRGAPPSAAVRDGEGTGAQRNEGATAAAPPRFGTDVERWFECPITAEVMNDPVTAADGQTYERSAIEAWLRTSRVSPLTGARMPHRNLVPNHQLRSMIIEWRERQPSM